MTSDRIIKIIAAGENQTLEFKRNFNNETIETLVAFSNSLGGMVIIGVSDRGEIAGVTINPESIQNWINEIKTKTSPAIIPDSDVLMIDNKQIVILSVQEYPIKPVSTKGKYFKRTANSNQALNTAEVVNMHLQTFNTSWDYHISNQYSIDKLSFEKVQQAIDAMNAQGSRINDDPLTFLIKKDLIRGEKITNASFLLFCKGESALTTIELGRFQGDTIIKDSLRLKCDILSQASR
jgi:ATP-dependent DNA helicase RecG